jgi:hypothetical protein
MGPNDDGLADAIARAREIAEISLDPWDWRKLHALEGVRRARSDAALLDALSVDCSELPPPPRWSEISEPGSTEGPLPF